MSGQGELGGRLEEPSLKRLLPPTREAGEPEGKRGLSMGVGSRLVVRSGGGVEFAGGRKAESSGTTVNFGLKVVLRFVRGAR